MNRRLRRKDATAVPKVFELKNSLKQRIINSMITSIVFSSAIFTQFQYEKTVVEGWSVNIRKEINNDASTMQALSLLQGQLRFIRKVLPQESVAKIQKIRMYFSPNYSDGTSGGAYHPGRQWLIENGRDPEMAQAIEFPDLKNFDKESKRMPAFALHELAHGYHHQFVKDGFENLEIKSAWESAVKGGKYNQVERKDHEGRVALDKAYALTNPQEYFAELTEAYFSTNDFFPFNRAELKAFDPSGYMMIQKMWKLGP
jgi:hypothetical protein